MNEAAETYRWTGDPGASMFPNAYTVRLYQERRDKLICALDFFEKLHHDDHAVPVEYLAAIGLFRQELETTQPDMKF